MSRLSSLVFVWLDQRLGSLPGGNEKLKEKFRNILQPLRQFDKPTSCLDFITDSVKDKRVLFITTAVFADMSLLETIAALSHVEHIYVFDTQHHEVPSVDPTLNQKMGSQRMINFDERLYEQIVEDLVQMYSIEADRLDRARQNKEAKNLFQAAADLVDTIDDKDSNWDQIERDLLARVDRLS